MSDLHAPYEDLRALKVVEQFKNDFKPHLLVCLGDWLDSTSFSSHARDAESFDQLDEYNHCNQLLDRFATKSRTLSEIVWIDGNHEDRLYRAGNVPQEWRRLMDHRKWLELEKRHIRWFPYTTDHRRVFKVGKLSFVHGFSTGVSALRKTGSYFGCSVMGHTHAPGVAHHPRSSYRETVFNTGCLCDLNPPYMKAKLNNWAHGFGWGYLYKNGHFTFNVARLIGNKIHLEGKEYNI